MDLSNHLSFTEAFLDVLKRSDSEPVGVSFLQTGGVVTSPGFQPLAVVSACATVASCFMIFSPLASMFGIARARKLGKESPVPYFMLFAQAFFWVFYGTLTGRPGIVHVNMLCSVMVTGYLFILGVNANAEDAHVVRPLLVAGILAIVGTAACVLCLPRHHLRVSVFARLALVFNILLYVAPCVQVVDVIRFKSIEGFPVALTSASFVSSMLWAQYAWLVGSVDYLLPNVLGVIFNGSQLAIIIYVSVKFAETPVIEEADCVTLSKKQAQLRAEQAYGTGGTGEA